MTSKEVWTDIPFEEASCLLNDCAYLFATNIRELEELTLCLTIVEAKPQAVITEVSKDDAMGLLKMGGRPVEADATCRHFRLLFDRRHMVSYSVLNEDYSKSPDISEAFTGGKLFKVFSRSNLLKVIKQTTYASDDYPATLMHFEIACQNHVIDVICTAPPVISTKADRPSLK